MGCQGVRLLGRIVAMMQFNGAADSGLDAFAGDRRAHTDLMKEDRAGARIARALINDQVNRGRIDSIAGAWRRLACGSASPRRRPPKTVVESRPVGDRRAGLPEREALIIPTTGVDIRAVGPGVSAGRRSLRTFFTTGADRRLLRGHPARRHGAERCAGWPAERVDDLARHYLLASRSTCRTARFRAPPKAPAVDHDAFALDFTARRNRDHGAGGHPRLLLDAGRRRAATGANIVDAHIFTTTACSTPSPSRTTRARRAHRRHHRRR